jgi:uncharacterized protein
MGQPVVHFEIVGRNPEKLHGFYADLFGWEFDVGDAVTDTVSQPGRYGFVHARPVEHGTEGINGGVCGGDGFTPRVLFYVAVDDVEATLRRAESLGGTRRMGPEPRNPAPGGLVVGMFTDPEGNLIGVARTVAPGGE